MCRLWCIQISVSQSFTHPTNSTITLFNIQPHWIYIICHGTDIYSSLHHGSAHNGKWHNNSYLILLRTIGSWSGCYFIYWWYVYYYFTGMSLHNNGDGGKWVFYRLGISYVVRCWPIFLCDEILQTVGYTTNIPSINGTHGTQDRSINDSGIMDTFHTGPSLTYSYDRNQISTEFRTPMDTDGQHDTSYHNNTGQRVCEIVRINWSWTIW